MDLRERLGRLGYAGVRLAERPVVAAKRFPDVSDLLPGEQRGCFVARRAYPLDYAHGGVALSDLLAAEPETLALLTGDARLAALDLERTVLVDTETTGLSGGTGTFVFMIGLGYFAGGAFRIDQFFLRDPSEERAMLGALGDVLAGFDAIVTFNGRCFDWPLIDTRHRYHRVPLQPVEPLHLDLLFPARRLFKRRLTSCALDELEVQALGMRRRLGDVPGFLIPRIYFDYLRERNGAPLVPVFEHNRRDILTMLALAVRMVRAVEEPSTVTEGWDVYSLAQLFDDAGQLERAIPCYERALAAGTGRVEVSTRLASAYKRFREADQAVALWESMVAASVGSVYPYVELAKHLEHRRRDFPRAADLTRRAIRLHPALRSATPAARHAVERVALRRRLERLERKMACPAR